MKFITISKDIEPMYMDFLNEFLEVDGKVVPWAAGLHGKTFDEFVVESKNYEVGILPDPTHVPGTTFYMIVENMIVGAISIRHELNDYLLKHGGHIGYGVRPSQRGKGYATELLEYGKQFLKELGAERALLTCDKENPASRRVIEKCGGVFESEITSDKRTTQRFWIQL